ncbi:hypothetical protein ACFYNN_29035 [Streptomyces sp. NPDC006978]|uniref:hypothetical protein n=1 Tax=Streptomyces sp. NPDC006978 TaxID=3364769 RepID=UPI0036BE485D
MLRSPLLLTMTALVYGVLLHLVNFQVLGHAAFPFFTGSKDPNQALELLAHPLLFGLFLFPFFLGWGRTRHTR